MEVWIKPEQVVDSQMRCLICFTVDVACWFDQEQERVIYENLVNEKVNDEELKVVFCDPCSQKLLDLEKFKVVCRTALDRMKELVREVKVEDSPSPTEVDIVHSDDNDEEAQTITPKRTSYCSICQEYFANFLGNHVKKVHLKTFKSGELTCTICESVSFKSTSDAMRHFHKNHLHYETPRTCTVCNATFTNAAEYSAHRKKERIKPEHDKLECHFCGFKALRRILLRHIQVTHMEGKRCRICCKIFFSEEDLGKHMEEEKTKKKKISICSFCGEMKPSKPALMKHIAIKHSGDPKIPCKTCGKKFNTEALLSLHSKVHAEKKIKFCDICGMSFKSTFNLNRHIKSKHQAAESAVTCDICHKSFSYTSMKSHRMVHSDVRPHQCPICFETFKSRTTLRKHSFSHSKTRPFNCLHCNTGYYNVSYLTAHYERQHGIVYTNQETMRNCRREKPNFEIKINQEIEKNENQ